MNDAPTLVAVSIGNSTTAVARYSSGLSRAWPNADQAMYLPTRSLLEGDLDRAAKRWPLPTDSSALWLVASVHRGAEQRLAAWVAATRASDRYHRLVRGDLALQVNVEQPERVGIDRLVAAVAVNGLRAANRAAVVVDAGTAVTVDLVDAAGVFQGGMILPGLAMTGRALSEGTDALPFVPFDPDAPPPAVIGKSTEQAITGGLFWGTVGAVREGILRMSEGLAAPPEVYVSGGDARRMAPVLGDAARYVGDLVLGGIAITSRGLV